MKLQAGKTYLIRRITSTTILEVKVLRVLEKCCQLQQPGGAPYWETLDELNNHYMLIEEIPVETKAKESTTPKTSQELKEDILREIERRKLELDLDNLPTVDPYRPIIKPWRIAPYPYPDPYVPYWDYFRITC